jgi:hypothetical protein
MIQDFTLAAKLALGAAAMPFTTGFMAILVTGLLLRRGLQWGPAITCGLVCVFVHLSGTLSGAWQEGALLGYAVMALVPAVWAALRFR